MVDPGEDSKTAAARELLEETGYVSDRWRYLGAVEPNPAFHNHLCHHWLAEDIYRAQSQDLGEGESIALEFMTQEQVRDSVCSGELKHALALSALSVCSRFGRCPSYTQNLNFHDDETENSPGSPSLSALEHKLGSSCCYTM